MTSWNEANERVVPNAETMDILTSKALNGQEKQDKQKKKLQKEEDDRISREYNDYQRQHEKDIWPIGKNLFDKICQDIENSDEIRKKIAKAIEDPRQNKNGKVDIVYADPNFLIFEGRLQSILPLSYETYINAEGNSQEFSDAEYAKSFSHKKIKSYHLQHEQCRGWKVTVSSCTSSLIFWARHYTISIQKVKKSWF